jgi:hypothetical protein
MSRGNQGSALREMKIDIHVQRNEQAEKMDRYMEDILRIQ